MDLRLLLILAIGLPLGFVTLLLVARASLGKSRAWPSTPGRVVSAGVQETTVRVRQRSSGSNSYRMAIRYGPRVVYEYTVKGSSYRAERLHMGSVVLSSDAESAERVLQNYPPGSMVTVYYDPSDPAQATLDPRTGWGTWVGWSVAIFLFAVMGIVAVLVLAGPPISIR
jgi:hypothetical protein